MDSAASWSPDGRHIAFLRVLSPEKWGVFLTPPLGGPERKLAEISAVGSTASRFGPAWSPDSRWLVVSDRDSPAQPGALFLISVESGEKRKLTSPEATQQDRAPAFSPDGQTLAFVRGSGSGLGDVHLLELTEDLTPRGVARRLTSQNSVISRPAWTPDGREVIFSSGNSWENSALFRIEAAGQAQPRRLDFAGEGVWGVAVSSAGRRLAYARTVRDTNVWQVETAGANTGRPRKLVSSTRQDFNPQFSPDGKKIAFGSDRSGNMEIWVCAADGSNAVQLTSFGGLYTGTPRWSPDGQHIVFDSFAAGNWGIYVISAGGGKPRALTTQPSQDTVPSWSHDGRWIYFSSSRSGNHQIWKIPPGGGEAVQVTRNGGYVAFESPDGRTLFYTKSFTAGPLFRLPLEGGAESQVLESVYQRAFAVTDKGIYFISAPDDQRMAHLGFYDFASGQSRPIATLDQPLYLGLAVSPDGRTVLYSQYDSLGSDLMLVENFR